MRVVGVPNLRSSELLSLDTKVLTSVRTDLVGGLGDLVGGLGDLRGILVLQPAAAE